MNDVFNVGVDAPLPIIVFKSSFVTFNWFSLADDQCTRRQLPFCQGVLPYAETKLPNWVGDTNEAERNLSVPYFEIIAESECHPRVEQYACAVLEPPCQSNGIALPPCRQFCRGNARLFPTSGRNWGHIRPLWFHCWNSEKMKMFCRRLVDVCLMNLNENVYLNFYLKIKKNLKKVSLRCADGD